MKRKTCNFLKVVAVLVISIGLLYLLMKAAKWELAEANGYYTITKEKCYTLYALIVAGFASIFALIGNSCVKVTCACGKKDTVLFDDVEIDCGGKNHVCAKCQRLYWIEAKTGDATILR